MGNWNQAIFGILHTHSRTKKVPLCTCVFPIFDIYKTLFRHKTSKHCFVSGKMFKLEYAKLETFLFCQRRESRRSHLLTSFKQKLRKLYRRTLNQKKILYLINF